MNELGDKLWWLVWADENTVYADSFDHEPTNEDTLNSSSNKYWQVGQAVKAITEEQAINLAFKWDTENY